MTTHAITIDLSPYSDGLEPHTIDKIIINGKTFKVTEHPYIGDLSELPAGYYYEIIDSSNIRIFPVNPDDTIKIPVIFKTSDSATEIPAILIEDYLESLVSGVIAKIRMMPDFAGDDIGFHVGNYKRGVSKAKNKWFKNNTGRIVKSRGFV